MTLAALMRAAREIPGLTLPTCPTCNGAGCNDFFDGCDNTGMDDRDPLRIIGAVVVATVQAEADSPYPDKTPAGVAFALLADFARHHGVTP